MTKRPGHKTQRFVTWIGLSLLAAVVLVSLFLALSWSPAAAPVRPLGIGLAACTISGAAAALGAAAGFLFGMPRARVLDDLTDVAARSSGSAEERSKTVSGSSGSESSAVQLPRRRDSTRYLTNSNLIKVSDWLTTILIGLGLVNLGQVIPGIRYLAGLLKAPLGGTPYAATVGVSMVIGTFLASFLLTYLWTLIRVRELLEDTERQSDKDVVPNLQGKTVSQAQEDIGATSLLLSIQDSVGRDISIHEVEDQLVLTQSHSAGSLVARGATVRITVEPKETSAQGTSGGPAEALQRPRRWKRTGDRSKDH